MEKQLHARELQLGLSSVPYPLYEAAIKRYGYVGQVRDETLLEVAGDIHLNYSKLNDAHTSVNHFYRASRCFDHGNYNSEYLLVLGFLLAHHSTIHAAEDALWGLLNPSCSGSVPRARFLHLVDLMVYYATEVPADLIAKDETADPQVRDYCSKAKTAAH